MLLLARAFFLILRFFTHCRPEKNIIRIFVTLIFKTLSSLGQKSVKQIFFFQCVLTVSTQLMEINRGGEDYMQQGTLRDLSLYIYIFKLDVATTSTCVELYS